MSRRLPPGRVEDVAIAILCLAAIVVAFWIRVELGVGAIVGAIVVVAIVRRANRPFGYHLCPACGRDVRSVEGRHCPECGARIVISREGRRRSAGAEGERAE